MLVCMEEGLVHGGGYELGKGWAVVMTHEGH